jgi:Na+-driven multidrug efflux pump
MDELFQQIQEQIQIAVRNRDRNAWIVIVCVIMGIIFSVIWIFFNPNDHPAKVIAISVFLSILLGIILPEIVFRKYRSKCPKCGMNWDMIALKKTIEATWPVCPGCGLNLVE